MDSQDIKEQIQALSVVAAHYWLFIKKVFGLFQCNPNVLHKEKVCCAIFLQIMQCPVYFSSKNHALFSKKTCLKVPAAFGIVAKILESYY